MEILATINEFVRAGLNPNGVLEILKREHREMAALMYLVEESKPGDRARTATFEDVASLLVAHAQGEEDVLYSVLDKIDDTHAIALEAVQEHHVIDLLVAELRAIDVRGEEWLAKFHVLRESVEHHVKEEEDKFFPKARTVLSAEEQVEMADAYTEARDRHLGEHKRAPRKARSKRAQR